MIASLKRDLGALALAVLTIAILGEALYLAGRLRVAERARTHCAAKLRELESFRTIVPEPTLQIAESISADVLQVEREWRELREMLFGEPTFFGAQIEDAGTGERTEAFFDLARFVGEIRAMADSDGVRLRQNEYFSFSTYANSAPEADVVECVLRQRQSIAHLLTILFDARPASLDGIRRERPRPAGPAQSATGARAQGRVPVIANSGGTSEGSDFFTLDPRLSLRKGGKLNTLAFRIVFSGGTASLRSLLNGLAHCKVAWLVRSVDVEPTRATIVEGGGLAARKPDGASTNREIAPVVRETISQFTVTVEIVEPTGVAAVAKISAS